MFRLLKPFRNLYVEGLDLGRAMVQSPADNTRGRVIDNAEIREIAKRYSKTRQVLTNEFIT